MICRKCKAEYDSDEALCWRCKQIFFAAEDDLKFIHDMNEKHEYEHPDTLNDFDLDDYEYLQDIYNESGLARRCPLDI